MTDRKTLHKSTAYLEAKFKNSLCNKMIHLPLFFGLFVSGSISEFSTFINGCSERELIRALLFFLSFSLFFYLIDLPFNLYHTFIIEKRFGFNRQTPLGYLKDTLSSGLIALIFTALILTAIITFITQSGAYWWIYGALFMVAFSLLTTSLFPVLIAPLFNKFAPLEEGELKELLTSLACKAEFPLSRIYTMDASKRTGHANAYFTGIGKRKQIVLFDTLLQQHDSGEIAAILAHEIGHYKLGHLKTMLLSGMLFTFTAFYLAGLLINNDVLYLSFGFDKTIYIGLFIVSIIFTPLAFILTPLTSLLARRHEYEADRYAATITGNSNILIEALIGLHRENLANPSPHPLYSAMYYSHPTILARTAALEKINSRISNGKKGPINN